MKEVMIEFKGERIWVPVTKMNARTVRVLLPNGDEVLRHKQKHLFRSTRRRLQNIFGLECVVTHHPLTTGSFDTVNSPQIYTPPAKQKQGEKAKR